ncbi:MAG: peptide chain release factor-like protein [Planctomycetes bacterium]|nr:peptide chain release factor-like protein [Planctomycetota bacterium]
MSMTRDLWTDLSDEQLLAQCEVDTYRASGPGGQKRNKTSSAVRIRHPASGLIVIAEESRSQHENRARALRRLRQAFFLKIRDEVSLEAIQTRMNEIVAAGRLELGRKDPRFWPAAGLVLDLLVLTEAKISTAAESLGISTANLVSFLETEPKLWEHANQLRARFNQKPLR